MTRKDQQGQQGAVGSGRSEPDLHPRARAFFREVAEARRAKRQAMAELDPGSALFQALTGAGKGRGSSLPGGVRPVPGEGIEPPGPGGDAPTLDRRLEGARFGLNCIKAWTVYYDTGPGRVDFATKYGWNGASVEDAARLGARVVRQPGQRDLLWAMLAPLTSIGSSNDITTGQDVPLDADLPAVMANGLPDYDSNVQLLAEELEKAREQGVKLVFTFMALGGGAERPCACVPPLGNGDYDEDAVDYDDSVVSPGSQLSTSGAFEPTPWSSAHDGVALEVAADHAVVNPVLTDPTGTTTGTASLEWFHGALDPACPYKRVNLGKIAREAANLLLAAAAVVRDNLGGNFDLEDAVEAIEIFNEMDVRDRWDDPGQNADRRASGEMWGRAYLHAAWQFRALLPEAVKLWMPGVASYGDDTTSGLYWSDKLAFADGFIRGMAYEAVDHADTYGFAGASEFRARLKDLAQGCDLHWYHGDEGGGARPRHVGSLVLDVAELREAILAAIASEWELTLTDFPITVFENGWSLDGDLPPGFDASRTGEFQAWEVWRRLGGALAGGAAVAGWHPWMANDGGNFANMGLREDANGDRELASSAVPRLSWYAYWILAHVLGGQVRGGRMVLPAVASRTDLEALPADEARGVVLEFDLGPSSVVEAGPWAYLVICDPSGSTTPNLSFRLVATPVGLSRATARIVAYYPWAYQTVAGSSGDAHALPYDSAVVPIGSRLPVGPIGFDATWDPRLVVSDCRLSWVRQPVASLTGPLAVHATPAWMDDAGQPLPRVGKANSGQGGRRKG